MKVNIKKLVVCIAVPLLVGGIASLLTRDSVQSFATLNKPPFAPPAWLFPVVWTILYTLMGISSYLIAESDAGEQQKEQALATYFYQLTVNFLWSIFFFNFEWYLFSFFWLLLLWVLVGRMIKQFSNISKPAAWMNVPYIVWITIAGYLNLGIWILNR